MRKKKLLSREEKAQVALDVVNGVCDGQMTQLDDGNYLTVWPSPFAMVTTKRKATSVTVTWANEQRGGKLKVANIPNWPPERLKKQLQARLRLIGVKDV